MLCELKRIANISNATNHLIEKFLRDEGEKKTPSPQKSFKSDLLLLSPDAQSLDEDEGDDLAENDTGIKDLIAESTSEPSGSELPINGDRRWMKTSLIVASHNLDILVIAAVQKFVVLQKSPSNRNNFESVARVQVELNPENKATHITSILPLCIVSTRPTNSTNVDWTCICVGLSDGNIQFYTEGGVCVFVEKCSNEPISALRFGPSIYRSHQELVALTGRNRLVVIEGLSLIIALRNARNQIALGEKTVQELSNSVVLDCHCVELDSTKNVHDFVVVSLVNVPKFDQLVNASCSSDGRDAATRKIMPVFTNYFCANKEKFCSFEWHAGEKQLSEVFGDMVYNVTSQVANVLPSFGFRSMLGLGISRKDRPSKMCAMDAHRYRCAEKSCIYDNERKAERCYMAPGSWNLLAVADSCARVLLIDTNTQRIIRIWKGYRNARCAWVEAAATTEVTDDKGARFTEIKGRTLFLVIFAPKRALLEVWSMQNGPRVSAFEVHEKGRLLAIDAAERATLLGSCKTKIFDLPYQYTTAVFIHPDGSIYDIRVPFHLSAVDNSVSSIHDDDFLKTFKISALLRVGDGDGETVDGMSSSNNNPTKLNVERCVSHCLRLQTGVARRRFLDMIESFVNQNLGSDCDSTSKDTTNNSPNLSLNDLHCVIEKLCSTLRENSDPFSHYVQSYALFLRICIVIKKLNMRNSNDSFSTIDYDKLQTLLHLGDAFDQLELPILRYNPPEGLSHCPTMSLKSFKEQFAFAAEPETRMFSNSNDIVERIAPRTTKFENAKFGATIFGPFICGSADPAIFHDELLPLLNISTENLIEIYMNFWLDSSWNIDPQRWFSKAIEMMNLLIALCKTKAQYDRVLGYAERKVFYSGNMHGALLLCLMLQAARICRIERAKMDSGNPQSHQKGNSDESFVCIEDDELLYNSVDKRSDEKNESRKRLAGGKRTELFDLYIEQLKILALFHRLPWEYGDESLSLNSRKKPNCTLETLARKREGFYRELVGQWAVSYRPHPRELADLLRNVQPVDDEALNGLSNRISEKTIIIFQTIMKHLPITLQFEMTISECCWECASAWSRDESRRCTYLSLATKYLKELHEVPHLQNALVAKLWATFIMRTFKNLYGILNANFSSKGFDVSSKDRVLRRDVLITETDLLEYTECVRNMLNILADASAKLCGNNVVEWSADFGSEPVVSEFFAHSKIRSVTSSSSWFGAKRGKYCRKFEKIVTLDDVVNKAKAVNYHLALHHKHLASVMELMIRTGLKLCPNSLFNDIDQRAFFSPLDSHPLLQIDKVADEVRDRRQKFLEEIIEHTETNGIQNENDDYVTAWTLILGLMEDWKLNKQALKIKQAAVLYLYGFDKQAEKKLRKVKDRQRLLNTLSPIIAGRIKYFADEEEDIQHEFRDWRGINSLPFLPKSEKFAPKFPDVTVAGLRAMIDNTLPFTEKPAGISHLFPKDNKIRVTFATEPMIRLFGKYDLAAKMIQKFYDSKAN